MSVSFTTPTMPAGYSKKRLISMVRNSSAGEFLRFKQNNERYHCGQTAHLTILSAGNSTDWADIDNQGYVRSELCSAIEYLAALVYTTTTIQAYVRKKEASGGKYVGMAVQFQTEVLMNFLIPINSAHMTQYQTSVPTGELTLYMQGAKLKL